MLLRYTDDDHDGTVTVSRVDAYTHILHVGAEAVPAPVETYVSEDTSNVDHCSLPSLMEMVTTSRFLGCHYHVPLAVSAVCFVAADPLEGHGRAGF